MPLTLREAVRAVLSAATQPLSPSQIRDQVKAAYPYLYQTEAHRIGIEKGNYQSYDHALLNPIYSMVINGAEFIVDRSQKPMLVSLAQEDVTDEVPEEDYEAEYGVVYVLGTGLFTEQHKGIIKIGHTTQALDARIAQLYTTGTPFQFKVIQHWRVKNYVELEQALHRLLSPYRLNRAREFFTADALAFVEPIVNIHTAVQAATQAVG